MGSIFTGTAVVTPAVPVAHLSPSCGKTWLSLDRWAQIIGINPLHFHQLSSATLIPNNVCGDVFFQSSFQHSDRVGRDDVCMAIQQAEADIAAEVGFNLMPDWTVEERLEYPRPGMPGVFGLDGFNTRGMFKSVEARRGWIISGGIKTKTLLDDNVVITRSDADGDGYEETCTITVAVTFTDTSDIHVYYPGQDGADAWEIRPIVVAISGGIATIKFKSWQVALGVEMFDINPSPLDADDDASYETMVDVYRIYNDPSTQLQFMWENTENLNCCGSCTACEFGTQAGCFHLRDHRLGILVPAPGSWNAQNENFDSAEWAVCRDPDQIRLWYYSGFVDHNLPRPYAEMSPIWEYAVAYYAASKLDRPVCGCSNVNQFIEKWRRDAAFESMNEGGFKVTAEMMANKLGTSMGALYAYRQIHRNGVRIIK